MAMLSQESNDMMKPSSKGGTNRSRADRNSSNVLPTAISAGLMPCVGGATASPLIPSLLQSPALDRLVFDLNPADGGKACGQHVAADHHDDVEQELIIMMRTHRRKRRVAWRHVAHHLRHEVDQHAIGG